MARTGRDRHINSLTAAVAVGVLLGLSTPATAQQTTYVGGAGGPSVEIDLSVLNALGTPRTIPEGHRQGLAGLMRRAGVSQSGSLYQRTGRDVRPPLPSRRTTPSRRSSGMMPIPQPVPSARLTTIAPSAPVTVNPAPPPAAAPKPKLAAKPAAPVQVASLPKTEPVSRPKSTAPTSATPKTRIPASSIPKLKTPPAPKTMAAIQPSTTMVDGVLSVTLPFKSGASTLSDGSASELAPVIQALEGDDALRVRLHAYSDAAGGDKNVARRLSLSRALAVRSYLMDKGVRSTRMDVRALGNQSSGGDLDRVEVTVIKK